MPGEWVLKNKEFVENLERAGQLQSKEYLENMEQLVDHFEKSGLGNSREERWELVHSHIMFQNAKEDKRKEQKSEDESFRKCPTCGMKGRHRCTGCYLELYCSEVCQRQDWKKGHKVTCKVTRAQFKEVSLTHHGLTGKAKKYGCGKEASKTKFMVKLGVIMEGHSITVRNEKDGFLGHLDRAPGQEEVYDKVRKEVVLKGVGAEGAYVNGTTSFFGCYYALYKGPNDEGGHKLEINPDKMQPMELW